MTIRKRLGILALIPIIVLIVIATVGLLSRQQLVDSLRTREMMEDVTLGVFDLNLLTSDYVNSNLERAEVQWQARYQSVGDTLSRVQVTSVEGQLALDRLRASCEEIGALFSSLVVITREAGVHHEEIAETLASQLFIESQTMVTDCSILADIADEELLNAQQRAAYVFWPTLILAVLGGLAGSMLIYRSIAKPVRELTEGAEIAGTGNLDHKIGTSAKDEIGQLSRAFDQMTANLKATTASRDELAVQVAQRKKAEEELRQYSEKLKEMVGQRTKELRDAQEELVRAERLATLGQFSGNLSHELRNPLGVVDSSAYYLKTKLEDADEKVQEHLDRIKSSVAGATNIIDSLLSLTRMKEPELNKLDLVSVSADAIATSKVPATVEVMRNFPRSKVLVNADGEQLRMAFNNIVGNALDAMDGMDGMGTLKVAVRSAAGRAQVSFADTGPGIPRENLEKVFQPLFSTKAQGIGFGLSIARMIVDRHGGSIEAKSEPGKGATIVIRLPLYKEMENGNLQVKIEKGTGGAMLKREE